MKEEYSILRYHCRAIAPLYEFARGSRGASQRGRGEDRGPYPQFFEDEDETEGYIIFFSRPRTRRGPRLGFLGRFEDIKDDIF